MGALATKLAKPREEQGRQLGDSSSCETKAAEKQKAEPLMNMLQKEEALCRGEDHKLKRSSVEGSTKKRRSLKELQRQSPPGFKEFDAKVEWRVLDEEVALQLWEDIFKPLCSFELLGIASCCNVEYKDDKL